MSALWKVLALAASAAFSGTLAVLEALLRPWPTLYRGPLSKIQATARARELFHRELRTLQGRHPLWCHVASAGELEEAIPVLEQLKDAEPERPILLTCFSSSGLRAAAREAKRRSVPWTLAGPIPLDLPRRAQRFVRQVAPSRAIFVHRELWPWHLRALDRARVPTALVQVRATRAGRQWSAVAPWVRKFVLVGTVTEQSAAAMETLLGKVPVTALGDARIDRIYSRMRSAPSPQRSRTAVLMASVWPEDIAALLQAFASPELQARPLIIVPHEPNPEFVATIQRALRVNGWRVVVRALIPGDAEVVATVGGLAERYADAAIAFVGGSFKDRVHNVLEPAVAGCTIVTGPFTDNAPDARAMEKAGALFQVRDGKGFQRVLATFASKEQLQLAQFAAQLYVNERQGAGERTAAALLRAWSEVPL